MNQLVILAGCYLGAATVTDLAAQKGGEDYSKRILGKWVETAKGKFVIFHANSSWGVQRNADSAEEIRGKWRVVDNKLTLTYSADEGSGTAIHSVTATYKIVSFTGKSFTTEIEGHKQFYERPP